MNLKHGGYIKGIEILNERDPTALKSILNEHMY